MQNNTKEDSNRVVFITISLVSLFVLFRTAWIGDDAFITMRTIDNWAGGYGLTWNVGERVQTYTHPLWLLLLSVCKFFIHDTFTTIFTISLAISLGVFIVFIRHFLDDNFSCLFGWGILIFSRAFIDYSSSGLENPLTHLLVLLFAIVAVNSKPGNETRHLLMASFLAGLGATNRMDTILFFIPTLAYLWLKNFRNFRGIGLLLLGLSPFILWEIFATFYYGFPFPNTAYAKLSSGIPQYELSRQGVIYFINSLTWDPITLIVIAISVITTMTLQHKHIEEKMIALGVVLYLAYVIYIGGDFMSGRYFSAVLLLSVFLLLRLIRYITNYHRLVISGVILMIGLLSPTTTISYFLTNPNLTTTPQEFIIDPNSEIADERQYHYKTTSPMLFDRKMNIYDADWMKKYINYKEDNIKFKLLESMGIAGYLAGPDVYILDVYALSDPLLARLQMEDLENWRIGHFRRNIPKGYISTLKTGKNQIDDPNLGQYYEKLKIITSAPLFSKERMKTILEMNIGKYDYLLDMYIP